MKRIIPKKTRLAAPMTKVIVITIVAFIGAILLALLMFGLSRGRCGDDRCQRWELRRGSCPADCSAEIATSLLEAPIEKPINKNLTVPQVKKMTVIKHQGKSVDWSAKKNLIVSAKAGLDRYYDVIVFKPDGSGEKCLTCKKTEIPQKHLGNPAWHPSGEYIVFTAEKAEVPDVKEYDDYARPGRGMNNDLYLMNADGTEFWLLQSVKFALEDGVEGIIHPQFSHNGKMLLWTERLGPSEQPALGWGEWALKLADFQMTGDGPKLSNIRTLQPGDQRQFYESHGFSPDDTKIMYAASAEKGQKATGMDIYEYTIETAELKRITRTMIDWDEHAHWSPDGKYIAWMSSVGFKIDYPDQKTWYDYLKSELWMMHADGSDQTRLTYFNTPGYPEYKDGARVIIGDTSWSPDGKQMVMAIAYTNPPENKLANWKLMVVDLE